MQVGKVDIPSACIICGASLIDTKKFPSAKTCGNKCSKELRRWAKLHHTAQADLYDAAKTFGELLIACDEAGGKPPPSVLRKATKMIESAAVAYTIAATKAGKLPSTED